MTRGQSAHGWLAVGSILVGTAGCLDSLRESENEQRISHYDAVQQIGPVGYWRLDETSGAIAVDSSIHGINGFYTTTSVELGATGALVDSGDSDTAIHTPGSAGSYVEIPDHKEYSLTRAWDDFNRQTCFFPPCSADSWGASPTGEQWSADVSSGQYYQTNGHEAVINPGGISGTFQQGLPTMLTAGDMQVGVSWDTAAAGGPLYPAMLVAQRANESNYVRAMLVEYPGQTLKLEISQVRAGVDYFLASQDLGETYVVGEWWYLRFEFDGPNYSAKAWKHGTLQPDSWLQAQTADSSVGTIAIRYSNAAASVQPDVLFDDFRAQTLGFTVSMFLKIDRDQPDPDGEIELWGKGISGDDEYVLRYLVPHYKQSTDPNGHLKFYVLSKSGGHGVGEDVEVCDTCPVQFDTWTHLLLEMEPGDALDPHAGPKFYVNGRLGTRSPGGLDGLKPGGWYNGSAHCDDAISVETADGSYLPGVPGKCDQNHHCHPKKNLLACSTDADCSDHQHGNRCIDNYCTCDAEDQCGSGPNNAGSCNIRDGEQTKSCEFTCWNVYPANGGQDIKVGTKDGHDYLKGGFDELAIFARSLRDDEIGMLYAASGVPNGVPTANVGVGPLVTYVGRAVSLDGTQSVDPDGDPITFSWSLAKPLGSAATLSNPTSATPTIAPDVVGDFVATLVVSDDRGGVSSGASITIQTVTPGVFARVRVQAASAILDALPVDALKTPGAKVALHNALEHVATALAAGRYDEAYILLRNTVRATDGWSLRGKADGPGLDRDLVIQRAAATTLYDLLAPALVAVETLL